MAGRGLRLNAPGRFTSVRAISRTTTRRPREAAFTGISLDALVLLFSAALALHFIGLLSLVTGILDPLFNDAVNRLGKGADFFAVYKAGNNLLAGESVYNYTTTGDVPYAYPFRYLPSVGYSLGALFNVTYPWTAYWSWVLINEVLLVVNLYLTWRATPDRRIALVGMSLWLLFSPFYLELFLGQFSFAMASLFFWTGLALHRSETGKIGPIWVTSLLLKTNSLIFLPLWLRFRMGRTVLISLAVVVGLNLPYFLLVDGAWAEWSGNFASLGSGAVDPHPGNLGLPAFLETIQRDVPGTLPAMIAALPWGFAVLGLCGIVTLLAGPAQKLRLLALWICAYFLVFAEVWEHHYVMLLPAVMLLVLFDVRLRPLALAAGIMLALPTPYLLFSHGSPPLDYTVVDPQIFWSSTEVYLQHLSKLLPTMLLFSCLVTAIVQGEGASIRRNIEERRREYGAVYDAAGGKQRREGSTRRRQAA
nr:D182 [uncultured bacterium]